MEQKRTGVESISPGLLGTFIVAIVLIIGYIVVYQTSPFGPPWDDLVINGMVFLAALAGAIFASWVWKQFGKDEPPGKVWMAFALGLWCWTLGEGYFTGHALVFGEVPLISLSDFFWLIAYFFFAQALIRQYRIISSYQSKKVNIWMAVIVGGVILISAIFTVVAKLPGSSTELTWPEIYLGIFYTFADLTVALVGLRISRLFGRGLWGRVWLGLLVVALSDMIYSWLTITGLYRITVEYGNPLSLVSDTLYFVAYLILALACYSHLLLFKTPPPIKQ